MDRKKFIKSGLMGMGSIMTLPPLTTSCKDDEPEVDEEACQVSPSETAGPFPIKSPADLIRENIVGDRTGVPFADQYSGRGYEQ